MCDCPPDEGMQLLLLDEIFKNGFREVTEEHTCLYMNTPIYMQIKVVVCKIEKNSYSESLCKQNPIQINDQEEKQNRSHGCTGAEEPSVKRLLANPAEKAVPKQYIQNKKI